MCYGDTETETTRQRKHQETQLVHRSASGKCGHSQEEDTCAVAGDDILYGLG
jgi:hypothetical protein